MREVAQKAIPKKEVEGDEESVWSKMQVLQVLVIPLAILYVPFLHTLVLYDVPVHACPCSKMFGCLSVGQVLQMIQVSDEVLPHF